jgi:hypothetical protein
MDMKGERFDFNDPLNRSPLPKSEEILDASKPWLRMLVIRQKHGPAKVPDE